MALTSALFTGLSGLDVNQARLNVVGNNIANVNTTAFKGSRSLFKAQFYVTDFAGSPASADFGGQNPSQRGLGAAVASLEKDFTGGSIEPTGRSTDMAISGNGFFILQGQNQRFTRDGSFKLNGQNVLVSTSGDFVQGYGVDDNFNIIPGRLQNIRVPVSELTLAQASRNASLQGNLNAGGQIAAGSSIINSQAITSAGGTATPTGATLLTDLQKSSDLSAMFNVDDVLTLAGKRDGATLDARTFTVGAGSTLNDLLTFFNEGLGIDTSVLPPTGVSAPGSTFKPDASTPVNPNSIQLAIVGNTGKSNLLSLEGGNTFKNQLGTSLLTFDDTGTDAAGIVGIDASVPASAALAGESRATTINAFDSLGNRLKINFTTVFEQRLTDGGTQWRYYATSSDNAGSNTLLGSGTMTFDGDGQISGGASGVVSLDRTGTGADSPIDLRLDFSRFTAISDQLGTKISQFAQDGSPIGTLTDFSLAGTGEIIGSFSNGLQRTLGQLAVATFRNPQGLLDEGGNLYGIGANSGDPVITTPLSQGAGSVQSGSLELSNVDLSKEFTNLIVASTGFSAASRVITTSDQLIQELLNASR
jgi:flagellar hook protein FlgE